jgi:hypothetical protein
MQQAVQIENVLFVVLFSELLQISLSGAAGVRWHNDGDPAGASADNCHKVIHGKAWRRRPEMDR